MLFTVSVEDACVYTSSSSFDWILDSRASHHVTPCNESFVSYNPGDYGRVHLGNNHCCSIIGVGDIQIKMKDGQDIFLKQVRHLPEMRMSLISMGRLDDEGYLTSFGKGGWKISKGALVMAKGPKTGTLYTLKTLIGKSNLAAVTKEGNSADLWHNVWVT